MAETSRRIDFAATGAKSWRRSLWWLPETRASSTSRPSSSPGDQGVVADGLGLGGPDHLGVVRVGRGQGQLAVEAGVEGDLDLADRPRLGPGQLDPGLAARHRRGPSVVERADGVADPAVDHALGPRPLGGGRGGDRRLPGQVARVLVLEVLDGLVVAEEGLLQLGQPVVVPVELAGG